MLGTVLVIATLVLPVPQAVKLYRRQSSDGLSLSSLSLTILFSGTNAAATIIVKWPQIYSCDGGYGCIAELLDLAQQVRRPAETVLEETSRCVCV